MLKPLHIQVKRACIALIYVEYIKLWMLGELRKTSCEPATKMHIERGGKQ